LEGYEVNCPRHGATFDVRNGRVLSLPAIVDIPAYPTRIVDGQIEIGLPPSN
jgi:nitrite reductase/ring-hydroxylating ferredoxin subunit